MHDSVKAQKVAILCHPETDNFCSAVVKKFFSPGKSSVESGNLQDLYRMQFDSAWKPRDKIDSLTYFQSLYVAYELNFFSDASIIVFVYPMWFGSPPSIINGHVEIDPDLPNSEGMVTINEYGIITKFSGVAEYRLGYTQTEVLGHHVNLLIGVPNPRDHDEYLARYRKTSEGRIIGIDRRVVARHKDGSALSLELSIGETIGRGKRQFSASLRDLTQREKDEEQRQGTQNDLLHFTQVGAMGTIASTLAHELSQPLTAVTNYVQTSRILLDAADEHDLTSVREAMAVAEAEVLRASEILRRLRELVACGGTQKKVAPVAKVIADSCLVGLVGTQANGIVSRIDLAPELGQVFIDHAQIQQVLVNLIHNAIEAMAPNGRGEVRITSRNDGEFVRIIVTDTGPGLPDHVSEQLFQAFVSTKAGGMGLGLSICRTIVEAHGGKIWHETAPGGGASFQFTVPRVSAGAADD